MDFIERHGVGGHGFNQQRVAGYQLWRFWPDRDRLPFMDIHATATAEDRAAYVQALSRREGWRTLDRDGRFDYIVLDPSGADSLLVALDADPAMALVYLDDTGVLYVRREGRNGAVADSFGYRFVGGGVERPLRAFAAVAAATAASAADSSGAPPIPAEAIALRSALLAELDRLVSSSPRNARANSMKATLAIAERRFADARTALEAALLADPRTPLVHFRLASLALFDNRPADAIAEYERERKLGERPGLDLGIGMAHRLAKNNAEARRYFEREASRWSGTPTGRAAEQAMGELR
jgi:tetratricopeptide (TPR) repeat protein